MIQRLFLAPSCPTVRGRPLAGSLAGLGLGLAALVLAGSGCSDPDPPAAQASVSIKMTSAAASLGGGSCPPASTDARNSYIPKEFGDAVEADPVSANQIWIEGDRAVNRERGRQISCLVREGDDSWRVELAASDGNLPTILSIEGTINKADKQGTGTGRFFTREADEVETTVGMDCVLSVDPAVNLNGNSHPSLQIQPGVIFAEYDCAIATNPPATACRVSGRVLFEECSQ